MGCVPSSPQSSLVVSELLRSDELQVNLKVKLAEKAEEMGDGAAVSVLVKEEVMISMTEKIAGQTHPKAEPSNSSLENGKAGQKLEDLVQEGVQEDQLPEEEAEQTLREENGVAEEVTEREMPEKPKAIAEDFERKRRMVEAIHSGSKTMTMKDKETESTVQRMLRESQTDLEIMLSETQKIEEEIRLLEQELEDSDDSDLFSDDEEADSS